MVFIKLFQVFTAIKDKNAVFIAAILLVTKSMRFGDQPFSSKERHEGVPFFCLRKGAVWVIQVGNFDELRCYHGLPLSISVTCSCISSIPLDLCREYTKYKILTVLTSLNLPTKRRNKFCIPSCAAGRLSR